MPIKIYYFKCYQICFTFVHNALVNIIYIFLSAINRPDGNGKWITWTKTSKLLPPALAYSQLDHGVKSV